MALCCPLSDRANHIATEKSVWIVLGGKLSLPTPVGKGVQYMYVDPKQIFHFKFGKPGYSWRTCSGGPTSAYHLQMPIVADNYISFQEYRSTTSVVIRHSSRCYVPLQLSPPCAWYTPHHGERLFSWTPLRSCPPHWTRTTVWRSRRGSGIRWSRSSGLHSPLTVSNLLLYMLFLNE